MLGSRHPPPGLLLLLVLGNYYYNISNKTALKAAGGAGLPHDHLDAPVRCGLVIRPLPLGGAGRAILSLDHGQGHRQITAVAFCAAGAHAGSVFALSAGAVSFGQIVKAAEPAFAAVVGTKLTGRRSPRPSGSQFHSVIGGVCLATEKSSDFGSRSFRVCISAQARNQRSGWLIPDRGFPRPC